MHIAATKSLKISASAPTSSIAGSTPRDRGSQYGSTDYRNLLGAHGMRQSMSARANPYHNAWTESFMGTLKSEMLQGDRFADGFDARIELFAYIESYYNTHRKHSALGYRTPAQFEAEIAVLN